MSAHEIQALKNVLSEARDRIYHYASGIADLELLAKINSVLEKPIIWVGSYTRQETILPGHLRLQVFKDSHTELWWVRIQDQVITFCDTLEQAQAAALKAAENFNP